jgi:hypothetical protein
MSFVTIACPHERCGANPATLEIRHMRALHEKRVVFFCTCPGCERPVSLLLKPGPNPTREADWFESYHARGRNDLITFSGWAVDEIVPPMIRFAPEHTPGDIARLYRQARGSLRRNEPVAAELLLENVIADALTVIDGGAAGSRLDRIDALVQSERLPRQFADWAREVDRDATHAARGASAMALGEFTEALLQALFTTPSRFAARLSRPQTAAA